MVTVEPGPDGAVVVRGLNLDEVRARCLARPAGRPRLPRPSRAEILAAARARRWVDEPTQAELAADLNITRAVLRESVAESFGGWRQLMAITATSLDSDSTAE